MAWDLRLDPATRDLSGGCVAGEEEVLQRLSVRLGRLRGEWFLNRDAGLPWYNDGTGKDTGNRRGILGGKNTRDAALLIRREILETDGVTRVIAFNERFAGRAYSVYCEILLASGAATSFTLDREL